MIGGMADGSGTQHVTPPAWTIIPLLSWALATSGQDDAHGDPGLALPTPPVRPNQQLSNIWILDPLVCSECSSGWAGYFTLPGLTTLPRFDRAFTGICWG